MDLYALLGIARAASNADIERAYRRVARRYHPGVNPGDRVAAEMYRKVQQAYEVLSDRDRRHDYDCGVVVAAQTVDAEVNVAFHGFDFSAVAEGAQAATFSELFADVFQEAARRAAEPSGGDVHTSLQLSFEDAVKGGSFPISVVRRQRCMTCGGDGRVAHSPATCPQCGGEGVRHWARGHMVFARPCEHCGGQGQLTSQPCRTCAGEGLALRSEVVTVTLPPGIEPGATVVVPGRGHATGAGAAAGDLHVAIEVARHVFFRRAGRDVLLTLPLAVHEAGLGSRVDVPTLDGPVRLRIPPGTTSGQRFKVKGRGVPAQPGAGGAPAGDLIVEVQIALPAVRDERSKDLLREFGRLNDGDVRRHLFEGK